MNKNNTRMPFHLVHLTNVSVCQSICSTGSSHRPIIHRRVVWWNFNRNVAIDINTTRLSASEKAKTSLALFKCSGVKSTRSVTSTASKNMPKECAFHLGFCKKPTIFFQRTCRFGAPKTNPWRFQFAETSRRSRWWDDWIPGLVKHVHRSTETNVQLAALIPKLVVFHQPIWKICDSQKWSGNLPQFSGWKFQKYEWNHHL